MSKYLKLFETTSQYREYINGSDVFLPNVSVAKDAPTTVYFKPYVPPQPITYTASAKLSETTRASTAGLHTNAFNTTIKSHTFENGVGTIEFDGDVTSIGEKAFYYCSKLTSITIPDSVTSIGSSAFYGCSGLTSVTISDSITSISSGAFGYCSGLTSIVVDSANTVYDSRNNCNAIIKTSTNELIRGCNNTVIPNNVTSIGDNAFNGCSGLTSINIPDSVTSIGERAFSGCTGLTSIVVDSANTVYDSRDNCNAIIKTSTNELIAGCKNTIIPNSVTSIGERAFQNCSGLTSIDIPSGVTSIGERAFQGCTGLRSITSNATAAPTIQSSTFQNVKTNGTLRVPSGSTGYDTWMSTSDYYLGLYNWTKVEPMNIITYKASAKLSETTDQYAAGLHPNAFSGKSGQLTMTSHTFENGVGTIEFNGDITSIDTSAFLYCSSLTSIIIPNSVTSIGYGAFESCSNLTSITIPDSVTSIGQYAFHWCSGLTSITIPNSVTSIGDCVFYDCGLTSVTIGNSVTSIDDNAFGDCRSLTNITCNATTAPTITSQTFRDIADGGTLTVPSGSTGYDEWMSEDYYYLGKYGWTKVEQ